MSIFRKSKKEDEYKHPLSAKLLAVFASIGLFAGIICFLIGLTNQKDAYMFRYIGLGSFISSLVLFSFADITGDIHLIENELSKFIEDNRKYQEQIITLLQGQQRHINKPRYREFDDDII